MGSIVSRGAENKNDGYFIFGLLPEGLIQGEILTKLPVKLIGQLRCVCKSWKSVLSDNPGFVQAHLTRYSLNMNNAGIISRCAPFVYRGKFHPLKSNYLHIGGSVNGLVCVYHHVSCTIKSLGLWNPATHQYKDIPSPPTAINLLDGYHFCLSLGFDSISNDYKIVFYRVFNDRPLVADVYSCNAACWGKTSASTWLVQGRHCPIPAIVNGCPHWFNINVKYPQHHYVVYFDVKHEVFRLLPGMEDVYGPELNTDLVNLRDSLAFIVYDVPNSTSRLMNVHIFDERCGLWSKHYTVGPITMPAGMVFINCFRNGDLLFNSGNRLKLVSVNPETHAVLKIVDYIYDSSRCKLCFSYSFAYNESLVSVKGMNLMHDREPGTDILIIERSS